MKNPWKENREQAPPPAFGRTDAVGGYLCWDILIDILARRRWSSFQNPITYMGVILSEAKNLVFLNS
jgi:hypothetical protein